MERCWPRPGHPNCPRVVLCRYCRAARLLSISLGASFRLVGRVSGQSQWLREAMLVVLHLRRVQKTVSPRMLRVVLLHHGLQRNTGCRVALPVVVPRERLPTMRVVALRNNCCRYRPRRLRFPLWFFVFSTLLVLSAFHVLIFIFILILVSIRLPVSGLITKQCCLFRCRAFAALFGRRGRDGNHLGCLWCSGVRV